LPVVSDFLYNISIDQTEQGSKHTQQIPKREEEYKDIADRGRKERFGLRFAAAVSFFYFLKFHSYLPTASRSLYVSPLEKRKRKSQSFKRKEWTQLSARKG
jgi:hypothetical protein